MKYNLIELIKVNYGRKGLDNLRSVMILRFISTVTFGVFYSSLSLLMTQGFNLTTSVAVSITALFFAFHYALPVLGGIIGSYFNNFKQIFISGKVFQLLSALVLLYATVDNRYIFLGLGLFLVDSMVNVVSLNMLITNMFVKATVDERGLAFLKGHIWSNYGFIMAFLISGGIYNYFSIKYLFYVCAIFSVITIIYCYFCIEDHKTRNNSNFTKQQCKITLLMFTIAISITVFLANHLLTREIIMAISSILICSIFIWTIKNVKKEEKESIIVFFLFMLCSMGFWSIYMLGPTFLPIFIDGGVDTNLFGITIPPQWFHIICPLTTVSIGLMLSQKISKIIKNKELSLGRIHLYTLALICTALALLILYYIVKKHSMGVHSNCFWLITYIMILAAGEILLAPASMALVGDYIPVQFQGIYTGVNQMTIGLSVVLSGLILNNLLLPAYESNKGSSEAYIINFIYLTILVFSIAVIMLIFDRRSKKRVV